MDWIDSKNNLPDECQTVWAYNNEKKIIALACLVYEEGWFWAVSNGTIYEKENNIVSECELNFDYNYFTHWMPLPELPL